MLSQQLKSTHSLHLEDVDEFSAPSITVSNYNVLHNGQSLTTIHRRHLKQENIFGASSQQLPTKDQHRYHLKQENISDLESKQPSPSLFRYYFGYFSQPTRSRFGESSSTSLDKLWYTYSYIYRIVILILLAILLMPTADYVTKI